MDRADADRNCRTALVAPGKGILAADESERHDQEALRLDRRGVHRGQPARTYREMLFTTPGAGDHISGVILFDETIRQSAADGTPFPKLLEAQGIIPGIKVDTGAKPLAGRRRRDRHRRARRPARAAGRVPRSRRALREVARDVHDRRRLPSRVLPRRERARARRATPRSARKRASCRSSSPRCSWTATHTIERSHVVTDARARRRVLRRSCSTQHVYLRGHAAQAQHGAVGLRVPAAGVGRRGRRDDARVFRYTVPAAVPGIVFLSGGQSDEQATARPQRDEPARPAPVAAVVLVRPRAAGAGAQGVGRRGRQLEAGQPAFTPSGPGSTARPLGRLQARDGRRRLTSYRPVLRPHVSTVYVVWGRQPPRSRSHTVPRCERWCRGCATPV